MPKGIQDICVSKCSFCRSEKQLFRLLETVEIIPDEMNGIIKKEVEYEEFPL